MEKHNKILRQIGRPAVYKNLYCNHHSERACTHLVNVSAADGADAGEGAHAAVHPLPSPPPLEPRVAHPAAAAAGPADHAARSAHSAMLPEAEQL